jgi:hypothetical protein
VENPKGLIGQVRRFRPDNGTVAEISAVVFSKKSKIRQLRLAVSVEKIKGKAVVVCLPPNRVDVRIKARSLCDLCHCRPVTGKIFIACVPGHFHKAVRYF